MFIEADKEELVRLLNSTLWTTKTIIPTQYMSITLRSNHRSIL